MIDNNQTSLFYRCNATQFVLRLVVIHFCFRLMWVIVAHCDQETLFITSAENLSASELSDVSVLMRHTGSQWTGAAGCGRQIVH